MFPVIYKSANVYFCACAYAIVKKCVSIFTLLSFWSKLFYIIKIVNELYKWSSERTHKIKEK